MEQAQQSEESVSSSSDEIAVWAVHPDDDAIREGVSHWLSKGCEYSGGRAHVAGILESHYRGLCQMWVVCAGVDIIGVMTTEITTYVSGKKVFKILTSGGGNMNPERARRVMDIMEDYGREQGCDAISIEGRPGWKRVYPEFDEIYRVFEKEL